MKNKEEVEETTPEQQELGRVKAIIQGKNSRRQSAHVDTDCGIALELTEVKPKTVRKHKVETINRNQLANVLDTFSKEGRVVIALNISRDIGGSYEIVSFFDEKVPVE